MTNRRLLLSTTVSLVTTLVLFVVISVAGPTARILIAPAWMFGAVVSGDARHPNSLALWASLFFMVLAIVYLFQGTPGRRSAAGPSPRWRSTGLITLYLILLIEFLFYRPIGIFLLEATGQVGDVGPAFILNMLLYLAPGFLIVAVATTLLFKRTAERQPRSLTKTFYGLLIGNAFALLVSFAYYFARLAG